MSGQYYREKRRPVTREKYEKLKHKAEEWRSRAENLSSKYDKVIFQNEELEAENERLHDVNTEQKEIIEKLREDLKKAKNTGPDTDLLDELEAENKNQRKEIRSLKKENRTIEEKYAHRIATLERDAMLKDGKIQQLTEAKEDLRERYKELKADYREQQRWSRGVTSMAPRD